MTTTTVVSQVLAEVVTTVAEPTTVVSQVLTEVVVAPLNVVSVPKVSNVLIEVVCSREFITPPSVPTDDPNDPWFNLLT